MGEVFTQTFNCHVLCKTGELQKEEMQQANKPGYLKIAGKIGP